MRKSKIFKRLVAVAMATMIAVASAVPMYADTPATGTTTDTGTTSVNGNVGIDGTMLPLSISMTHQLTVNYSIDPNKDAGSQLEAAPITITNDTKCPVNVTVKSIASAPGGSLTFTDVGPNDKNWANLNAADTKAFIALGLNIANGTGWNTGYNTTTDWAASKTPVQFGTLASGATGNIALTAKSGTAFDNKYTSNASVVLVVNLA